MNRSVPGKQRCFSVVSLSRVVVMNRSVKVPVVRRCGRYEIRVVRCEVADYHTGKLSSSDASIEACCKLAQDFGMLESPTEKMCVVTLDTQHVPIGWFEVTSGTLDASLVHPREVFTFANLVGVSAIILCHNHPSGDPSPSNEDFAVTRRLMAVGELAGIRVLDHIVVGIDPVTREVKGCSIAAHHKFHPPEKLKY